MKKGEVLRKLTPGELVKWCWLVPQNAKGSEKGSAQAVEWHWRGKRGPCEEFTDGCGDSVVTKLPPPGPGPSHSHARPALPRAPPAPGTASRRAEEDRPDILLLPGAQTRKQLPLRPDEARFLLPRRKLPPVSRTGDVSENLGTITRSESTASCSPGGQFFPLGLLQSSPAVSL